MIAYAAKKFIMHFLLCLAAWGAVSLLSGGGMVYGGWLAGFFGACYLLSAWLIFLRSGGTDVTKYFRREKKPSVPYYLQGPDKSPKAYAPFFNLRHDFEDDKDSIEEDEQPRLLGETKQKAAAIALLVNAAAMFTLSFIS